MKIEKETSNFVKMLGSTLTVNEACRGERASKCSGKDQLIGGSPVTGKGRENVFYLAQQFGFGHK